MSAFGINGFGRIGRTALRVWWLKHRHAISLAVINTSGSMPLADWVNLIKYDSNYGRFGHSILIEEHQTLASVSDSDPVLGTLIIGSQRILVTAQKDPSKVPWAQYGVETVIESTGVFTTAEKAGLHLQGGNGAKRVIISAPAKGDGVVTSVLGVQHADGQHQVVSNASCTTNCVAPVAAVMEQTFGVVKAMLTTVHAYTDDQNLHDNSQRDMRRARGAAHNIVPTSTGAARAVSLVLPQLKDRFDGLAIRVPVPVGSLSDMVFVTKRSVTVEEVNAAFIQA
jgi:glyceraldehyde-3-phosphate dehydrogenase type I